MQSPARSTEPPNTNPKPRRAFQVRVAAFVILVLACGWYARFFQSMWTYFAPRTCATGSMELFTVDFREMPVRMSAQFNACTGIGDGECSRADKNLIIRGTCQNGQMHGAWSLKDASSGAASWTGTYCDGLPCGEFHRRFDATHEDTFHLQNLQIHGPATLWEMQDQQLRAFSGYYERGKRKGRWVRHTEPGHTLHSAVIYDENGFVSTTSFYCTNGQRKEIRGKSTFFFDQDGKSLPFDPAMPPACPLP